MFRWLNGNDEEDGTELMGWIFLSLLLMVVLLYTISFIKIIEAFKVMSNA